MPKPNNNARPAPWSVRHATLDPILNLTSAKALLDADVGAGVEAWDNIDDAAKDYLRTRIALSHLLIVDDVRRHLAKLNATTGEGYTTLRISEGRLRQMVRLLNDSLRAPEPPEDDEDDGGEEDAPPPRPARRPASAPAPAIAAEDLPEGTTIAAPLPVSDDDGFEGAPSAADIDAMEAGEGAGGDEDEGPPPPRSSRRKRR